LPDTLRHHCLPDRLGRRPDTDEPGPRPDDRYPHKQTNLLTEIARAVRQEPGPSPVVQSLNELTAAVVRMGAGLETVQAQMEGLPAAIEATFAAGDAQASQAG